MKAVIQRVRKASVDIDDRRIGQIDRGLVVLLGVAQEDNQTDVEFLVEKLPAIRVFSDKAGKMNKSLSDIGGALLIISQFTLLADTERGRRPSFEKAAPPDQKPKCYISYSSNNSKLDSFRWKLENSVQPWLFHWRTTARSH